MMCEVINRYCVKWQDSAKKIILVEVNTHWTWEDACTWSQMVMEMVKSVDHEVFVIYHYKNFSAAQLPRSTRVFANLKTLMQSILPQQNKIIIVNATSLMQGFMNILSKAYSLDDLFQKYYFVETLDEALALTQPIREAAVPFLPAFEEKPATAQ